jgi:hypothetical protein
MKKGARFRQVLRKKNCQTWTEPRKFNRSRQQKKLSAAVTPIPILSLIP